MNSFRNWVAANRETKEQHVERLEKHMNPLNEKCETLKEEWEKPAKPQGFWKNHQITQMYEYRRDHPHCYSIGVDQDTGATVPANSIDTVLYLTKKRAGKL
ncbi:hypothetical protein WA158_001917 [Blastocystis sp. Blastoise]